MAATFRAVDRKLLPRCKSKSRILSIKCRSQVQRNNELQQITWERLGATVLAVSLAVTSIDIPSRAAGIESIDFPSLALDTTQRSEPQRKRLDDAEDAFQNSQTLKDLLSKSETNKIKNQKEIQNKYCYRQAELGIGDCGGLQYIPGLTVNGKQKPPKWLSDLLGIEEEPQAEGSLTLKDLFGSDFKD